MFGPLIEFRTGDALAVLRGMASASVHCVVTSPPYYGLRDYKNPLQIGLERTVQEYVARLVEIFREVRRILVDDGVFWLNLGDSYAGSGKGGNPGSSVHQKQSTNQGSIDDVVRNHRRAVIHEKGKAAAVTNLTRTPSGLADKQLIGVPWRVAFALQDDGWILRQDIIWSKPNPMPESVADRCTKGHEYLFMFSKSNRTLIYRARDTGQWSRKPDRTEKFWRPDPTFSSWNGSTFDGGGHMRPATPHAARTNKQGAVGKPNYTGFNDRYFRPEQSAEGGKWVKRWRGFDYYFDQTAILEPAVYFGRRQSKKRSEFESKGIIPYPGSGSPQSGFRAITEFRNRRSVWTVSTRPYDGAHFATFPPSLIEPCILSSCPPGCRVLDPFGGAGTTALVARRHGREAVLIELNPDYMALARGRIG